MSLPGAQNISLDELFEPENLPRGETSRLLVELVHDGLGRPIAVPVLAARGERGGPVFGITAALHGNELNGIPVIHRLFERLDLKTLRGTVVAVVVANVPGYMREQREFPDGTDLNHIMPGVADGTNAQVYVHRLINRVVRSFDALVDLHTASFGRANSLYIRADMTNPSTAAMAYLQRAQIIVHKPASDGTLRGAAEAMGVPAITVEIGDPLRFQPEYIKRSLAGLRRVLAEMGMTPRRKPFEVPDPILCSDSRWYFTDHGGLLEIFPRVTDLVAAGEVYARLTNAFGDVTREYAAPDAGVIIGKSVNPVATTGARLIHLGRRLMEGHNWFLGRGDAMDEFAHLRAR